MTRFLHKIKHSQVKMYLVLSGFLIVCSLAGVGVISSQHAFADAKADLCSGINATDATAGNGCADTSTTVDSTITNIISLMSKIVGVVAVIMIIVAGFKYITANGDASKASSARSTIVYAIIGLLIVVLSQTLIYFVLNRVPAK